MNANRFSPRSVASCCTRLMHATPSWKYRRVFSMRYHQGDDLPFVWRRVPQTTDRPGRPPARKQKRARDKKRGQ